MLGGRLVLDPSLGGDARDQVAQRQLFYAPATGSTFRALENGAFANVPFLADVTDQIGLSLQLAGHASWARNAIYDVFGYRRDGVSMLVTRQWDAHMHPTERRIASGQPITTGTGANTWARPSAAFDGNDGQAQSEASLNYPSNDGLANWLGVDFGDGEAREVSRVVLVCAQDAPLRSGPAGILEVQISASNDGVAWAILTRGFVNAALVGATHNIPINVSHRAPYRYLRVGVPGNGKNSVTIAEIQMYEELAPLSRRTTKYDGTYVNDDEVGAAQVAPGSVVVLPRGHGTLLGCVQMDRDADGSVTSHWRYGPMRTHGLWNVANRKLHILRAGVSNGAPYAYELTSRVWVPIQASAFQMRILSGLPEEPIQSALERILFFNTIGAPAQYEAGIGVDTTESFSGRQISTNYDNTGIAAGHGEIARLTLPPFVGQRTLHGIEKRGPDVGSVSLFTDHRNTVLEASFRA